MPLTPYEQNKKLIFAGEGLVFCNVNPETSGALDGLIRLDLTSTASDPLGVLPYLAPRPAVSTPNTPLYIGHFKDLVENREPEIEPRGKGGDEGPYTLRIKDDKMDISGKVIINYNHDLNGLFRYPGADNTNSRFFEGGSPTLPLRNLLIIRINNNAFVQYYYECHFYYAVGILPTSTQTTPAPQEIDFKAIVCKGVSDSGGCLAVGKQKLVGWFVTVGQDGTNTEINPRVYY